MSTAAAVAAAAKRAERLLVEHLRNTGAVDPSAATSISDRRWIDKRVRGRLARAGAIREAGGKYYLDEAAYATYRADRSRRLRNVGLVLVPLIGAASLLIWWLTTQ